MSFSAGQQPTSQSFTYSLIHSTNQRINRSTNQTISQQASKPVSGVRAKRPYGVLPAFLSRDTAALAHSSRRHAKIPKSSPLSLCSLTRHDLQSVESHSLLISFAWPPVLGFGCWPCPSPPPFSVAGLPHSLGGLRTVEFPMLMWLPRTF